MLYLFSFKGRDLVSFLLELPKLSRSLSKGGPESLVPLLVFTNMLYHIGIHHYSLSKVCVGV